MGRGQGKFFIRRWGCPFSLRYNRWGLGRSHFFVVQIMAAFPEGSLNSGQVSSGEFFIYISVRLSGTNSFEFSFFLVSVMKMKEVMEHEDEESWLARGVFYLSS